MGAIFGFIRKECADEGNPRLEQMHESLRFRGDTREFSSSHLGEAHLGACRWEWEQGPRHLKSADGGVIAVCEGEIYASYGDASGYKTSPGDPFGSVPLLYDKYGLDFAKGLNGVFAIALWDSRNKKLVLVRDHLGSHSLFYTIVNGEVYFGSTAKSLLRATGQSAEVDKQALVGYLTSLAVAPPSSMLSNIRALRPGHAVVVDDGSVHEHRYWDLGSFAEDRVKKEEEWVGELKDLFVDAVGIRSAVGGKIGALVSGGVDTTSIVSALGNGGMDSIPGFSIAYDEQQYSDGALQQIVTNTLPVELQSLTVKSGDFISALESGAEVLDSPVNDVAFAGMYLAMGLAAKNGCNAVFDGEGADEFFTTGHSHGERSVLKYHGIPLALRKLMRAVFGSEIPLGGSTPSKVLRLLTRIGMTDFERRSTWMPVYQGKLLRRLLGAAAGTPSANVPVASQYYRETRLQDPINQYQMALSKTFLADDLLYKNERVSSAHSVMNRTPYIDFRLVEKAFQIPAFMKIQDPTPDSDGTKLIMKKALVDIVPDAILNRKKTRGFSQPISVWYRSDLRGYVEDHLFGSSVKFSTYLDARTVKQLWHAHLKGGNYDYLLNSILILELWLQRNA